LPTGIKIEVDGDFLIKMGQLGMLDPLDKEVAAFIGITPEAFHRLKKRHPKIQQYLDEGRARGTTSIRRQQFKKAMDGDTTMLIWLGKQKLGQTDKRHIDQVISHKKDIKEFTDRELHEIIANDTDSDLAQHRRGRNGSARTKTGT
jgi:hypothetical protein